MHIIGIKIKENCKPELIKNLRPGWYPFGNYDEPTKEREFKWRKGSELSDRLYQLYPNMPQISISCIIGKNGSGKTTLLDIMFRILNNFASLLPKSKEFDMYEVEFVEGLMASLYFEVEGSIGIIENKDKDAILYFNVNAEGNLSKIDSSNYSEILHELFYTIGINYSIHSMRFDEPEGMQRQINKWLCCLFHNEVDYQIPITLSPYRIGGQIDVNYDDYLANRRILTLSVLLNSQGKELIGGYVPKKIEYTLSDRYLKSREKTINYLGIRRGIGSFIEKVCASMRKAWEEELNKYSINCCTSIKQYILDSLAYESLFICMIYKSFSETLHLKDIVQAEDNKEKEPEKYGKYSDVITKIRELNHKTSITSDISQILSFLSNNTTIITNYKEGSIPVDEFEKKGLSGKKEFRTFQEVYELLPPQFYDAELYFAKNDNNKLIPQSHFSSGEKQMLYNNSAILYHIYNIASVREDLQTTPYKHINIVLDEVELYSHPEFQRNYIASFIDMLAGLHIDNTVIRSINIIIATHSPFIVSDVPQENILYLREGLRHENSMGTYSANIFDLLKKTFFMEYPMGECARRIIEKVIDAYNKNDEKAKQEIIENKYFYCYLESIIAEPYLKSCVKTMLRSILDDNDGDLYELLSKKAELENQIRIVNEEIAKVNEKN